MANVQVQWNTTQSGIQGSGGWVISNNGNTIRFNLETASNCGGSNSSTQSGIATATIIPGPNYDMSVALSGVGEAQDPGYEAITLSVQGPEISGVIYTAAASGGGLGCAVAPVTITQNQPNPFYLPAGTTNTLTANFTTRDSLYHNTQCFYQIDLSFQAVDPPTNIQFFRANDNSPTTTIVEGDPCVLTYDTRWNGQTSAYTAVINQGIGPVDILPGCNIDTGSILINPPLTLADSGITYTLTITGSTGQLQQSVEVIVLPPDNSPDPIQFESIFNADLLTEYTTAVKTISGLQVATTATATNGAQLRINGGAWTAGPASISNGDTIQLKMTSSGNYVTLKTTTILMGDGNATWKITTKSQGNNVPNPFTFNTVNDAPILTYILSNVVTITGITGVSVVTAPTSNNIPGFLFEASVDGGAWTSLAQTITNGQTLQLRLFTSATLGDSRTTSIIVGDGAAVSWTVNNVQIADENPDFFDFIDVSGAPASTLTDSNWVTINGINVSTNIICSNPDVDIIVYDPVSGATTLYGNATTIVNGQQVKLRILSSPDAGGLVQTDVTIGNSPTTTLTDVWRVFTTTGGDIIPDAFFFIDKNSQPPNTYITSNVVLVMGITAPSPITITNGEFRVNQGAWLTTGSIQNNQTLQLRMLSSASLATAKTINITLG